MATVNVAATTKTAPTVSNGTRITYGKKTYTVSDVIGQIMANYEQLYLLQEQSLELHRYNGEALLAIRSLFASDKLFGQFIAGTDLAAMSRQDRTDSMFVAKNWAEIQKLSKACQIDHLGVSALRKKLTAQRKEAEPKKPSAGNVSKGKVKQTAQAEKGTPAQETSVKALAAYVAATCEEKGWTVAEFAKELAALRSAKK